jgi:hypothetical protein
MIKTISKIEHCYGTFFEDLHCAADFMHKAGKDYVEQKEKMFQKFKKIWNLKNWSVTHHPIKSRKDPYKNYICENFFIKTS